MPDQHKFCHDHVKMFLIFLHTYKKSCPVLLLCKASFSETLQFINIYLATLVRPVISHIGMSRYQCCNIS